MSFKISELSDLNCLVYFMITDSTILYFYVCDLTCRVIFRNECKGYLFNLFISAMPYGSTYVLLNNLARIREIQTVPTNEVEMTWIRSIPYTVYHDLRKWGIVPLRTSCIIPTQRYCGEKNP